MVQIMDANIGKVLAQLDATQQRENTLVFFFSDNGGPKTWTDNTPLCGGKTDFYEGGARTPFLISWPAKLKPAVYAQPVISLDVMATALAQTDGKLPSDRPMDSVNLFRISPAKLLRLRTKRCIGAAKVWAGNMESVVEIGNLCASMISLLNSSTSPTTSVKRRTSPPKNRRKSRSSWRQSLSGNAGPASLLSCRLRVIRLPRTRPAKLLGSRRRRRRLSSPVAP